MGNSTQKKTKPQLLAGMLDSRSRDFLEEFADPTHEKHPNHHVTLQYGCSALAAAAFTGMQWRAEVIDVVTDGLAVVADLGEVEVLAAKFNEDHEGLWLPVRAALDACSVVLNKGRRGQDFHVTISHSAEVKAVHSNEVLRKYAEGGPLEAAKVTNVKLGTIIGGTLGWIDGGMRDHFVLDLLKGFERKLTFAHCVGRSGVGSKPLPGLEEQLLADIHLMKPGFVVNGGSLDLSPEAMALTAPGIARNSDIPVDASYGDHDHRGELHRCVEVAKDQVQPTTRGGMCFIWGLGSILVDLDSTKESEATEDGVPSLVREAILEGAIYNVVSLQANPYEGTSPAPVGPRKHDRKVAAGEIPEDPVARQGCVDFWDEGPDGHTLVFYK